MKILMCTDGQPYAEEAIRFGGRFAHGLDADVTVLFVRPSVSRGDSIRLNTARKKMGEWNPDVPSVENLKRAKEILVESGLVPFSSERDAGVRQTFRESAEGGVELHWVGRRTERVRLKLREGESAEQILTEARRGRYDLVLTGSRGHEGIASYFVGSTALRIAEFAPCSVLIAKNIRESHDFLMCTDGSRLAEKAELFGAQIAQALNARVTVLSVASEPSGLKAAQEQVRRAEMILAQLGVQADVETRVGRPSEVIIDKAKNHDIVVMGASGSSAVRRFFLGSVPLKVIEYGACPVLLVRAKPGSKRRGTDRGGN
ncbi:MAG TPA: universal stress protein [Nitrospiria bacterium]|nr:universal stress protein [Nitrospiria bacterium]